MWRTRAQRMLFRVGYAFTRDAADRFYTEQTVLDPTSLPPAWAEAMAREIDGRMKNEPDWRASVMRHYEMARSLR